MLPALLFGLTTALPVESIEAYLDRANEIARNSEDEAHRIEFAITQTTTQNTIFMETIRKNGQSAFRMGYDGVAAYEMYMTDAS